MQVQRYCPKLTNPWDAEYWGFVCPVFFLGVWMCVFCVHSSQDATLLPLGVLLRAVISLSVGKASLGEVVEMQKQRTPPGRVSSVRAGQHLVQ